MQGFLPISHKGILMERLIFNNYLFATCVLLQMSSLTVLGRKEKCIIYFHVGHIFSVSLCILGLVLVFCLKTTMVVTELSVKTTDLGILTLLGSKCKNMWELRKQTRMLRFFKVVLFLANTVYQSLAEWKHWDSRIFAPNLCLSISLPLSYK